MSWIEYTSFTNYPSRDLKSVHYECNVNKQIQENDGINSSWRHRTYLQKNTEMIINYNTKNALTHCNTNVLNIIDTGYSYNTVQPSDLKRHYLTKERSNVTCPSIPMT